MGIGEQARRVVREIDALSRASSPYLPQVLDSSKGHEKAWVVTEERGSTTLARRWATPHDGTLPDVDEVLEVGVVVGSALKSLHTLQPPFVHGDVSPNNVVVDALVAGPQRFCLIDLELGHDLDVGADISRTVVGGTPGFGDPALQGALGRVSVFNDVYSLAALILFGLSNTVTLPRDSGAAAHCRLDDRVRAKAALLAVLRRALSPEPNLRCSLGELIAATAAARLGHSSARLRPAAHTAVWVGVAGAAICVPAAMMFSLGSAPEPGEVAASVQASDQGDQPASAPPDPTTPRDVAPLSMTGPEPRPQMGRSASPAHAATTALERPQAAQAADEVAGVAPSGASPESPRNSPSTPSASEPLRGQVSVAVAPRVDASVSVDEVLGSTWTVGAGKHHASATLPTGTAVRCEAFLVSGFAYRVNVSPTACSFVKSRPDVPDGGLSAELP